jgi:adenine-specific DNA-methyltransferase
MSQYISFPSIIDDVFTAQGTADIREIFGFQALDFPKPSELIRRLVEQAAHQDDLVLDFFAGSATTSHAVFLQNRRDGQRRQFISVQLPEVINHESEASRRGFASVADIGKQRIHRVIAKMRQDREGQLPIDTRNSPEDLGFKVFKLAPSTFRHWEPPEGADADALEHQLSYFDHGLAEGADPNHVIYEVILKEGYSLNARIEPLDVETNQVYRVSEPENEEAAHFFYICLDNHIQDATLNALPLDKETMFVCLDSALNDSQKVNLAMQCLLKVI